MSWNCRLLILPGSVYRSNRIQTSLGLSIGMERLRKRVFDIRIKNGKQVR